MLYNAEEDNETVIWRLVAFLGRYAHQSVGELLRLTIPELRQMSKATARLLEEEAKAVQGETDS